MLKTSSRALNIVQCAFWLLIVVFTLTPCVVKSSILKNIDASLTYKKPLNKLKATTQNTHCQNNIAITQDGNQVRPISNKFYLEPNNFKINTSHSSFLNVKSSLIIPKILKSPPKYILFKQLKIAIS